MLEAREGAEDRGLYVYCVVPAATGPRASLRGIDGAEVEFLEHDLVSAVVSEMSLDRPPGRRAELVAHTQVVDALSARGPVLPVQFGSVLPTPASVVEELLEPEHDRFVHLLDGLTGRHQFNLRVEYVKEQVLAEVVRADPEIAELRRRTRALPEGTVHPDLVRLGELVSHAVEHKRHQDGETVLETVRPLVLDEVLRAGKGVTHVLDLAVLVDDDRVPELEQALEVLAEAAHERMRLRLTGPMAPYDFADDHAWA